MLGWTKSQELWGKGRRPGRKRQWCEAQLLGKSEVTNGFWGSELRLGLGRKRVRKGRVGLEGRSQAAQVGDPGAHSWVHMGCWGHVPTAPALDSKLDMAVSSKQLGKGSSGTQAVWPLSLPCLPKQAGEMGDEQVLMSVCSSAQLCKLIAPGAMSR